jgi:hypothetical protein
MSTLFDVVREPEFVPSDTLAELGESMLLHDDFLALRDAVRNHGLRIAYVLETKPWDPVKDELKPHTIAKAVKASALWRCMAEVDVVIQFRRTFWNAFEHVQREAVIHHEFTHIETEVDENDVLTVTLRPHDVEEFVQTARRYGTVLPGRRELAKALNAWAAEAGIGDGTAAS